MGKVNIDGVILTPLKKIETWWGYISCMKESDVGYAGFGEAIFKNQLQRNKRMELS